MDRRFVEYNSRVDSAARNEIESKQPVGVPWSLFQRQQIPPAPNHGPYIVDWLPEFAGYSWIAYGAESKLVVSIVPCPGGEELGVGRLFQQVLETRLAKVSDKESRVSVVRWGSARFGCVAGAAGRVITVFAPRFLSTCEIPALPLEWEAKSLLTHTHTVLHFSWTGSGDGILSSLVSKVLMWKQDGTGWTPAWQCHLESSQGLAAATWSYRGLAATANLVDGEQDGVKGKGTIWWWEEEAEPQAVELSHPKQVVDIQWRPLTYQASQEKHRPILLTSSRDGVVRLWSEIDSGEARLERKEGKVFKPSFFVSGLIDVNLCLQATLGVDCLVSWAFERSQVDTEGSVPACEWIVGIGPSQGVALWSLHCLDDVSPPRCPRPTLWQQGTFRPVVDSGCFADAPAYVKCVVYRAHSSVPPTSIDMVEVFPKELVRRSRVWPPVSSVGGGSSMKGSLDSGSASKISTWGRSCQEFLMCGHTGGQVHLSLHPDMLARVAASVDKSGLVLLWSTDVPLEPYIEAPGLHVAAWKICGKFAVPTEGGFLPGLNWSQLVLPDERMGLFISHSRGINCYLIARDKREEKCWLSCELLHELRLPVSSQQQLFEEIYVIKKLNAEQEKMVVVVASRSNGKVVMSWKFEVGIRKNDAEVETEGTVYCSSTVIETAKFHHGERILTAAGQGSPYDFISTCVDGSVRLWRVTLSNWECVGQVSGHREPLSLAASGSTGTLLATSSQSSASVDIWDIVCSANCFCYFHAGRIALPQVPNAMSWFEGDDGLPLLGVVIGDHAQVYVEARSEASEFASWTCLASVQRSSSVNGFAWGPRGSLVLLCGSLILILSHLVQRRQGGTANSQELLKVASLAAVTRSFCHPSSIFQYLLDGEQQKARICLRRLLSCASDRTADSELPNVPFGELQKPAGEMKMQNQSTKAWVFGKSMDDDEEVQMIEADGPLSSSDFQQLISMFGDRVQLLAVIKLVQELESSSQFNYLDQPGKRFTLLVRVNELRKAFSGKLLVDSKAMAWAQQSECKDTIINMLVSSDSVTWPTLRGLGVGYWFTDIEQLRPRIEKLARTQFMQKRDPKDCALFYIALERRTVLSGLCKLSQDERDRPLVEFFARDFQDERNKAAALKNAYVLMGKHRHELAAAFFLLGGDLDSAVGVCSKNLGDPQLALVLCRLVQGNNGQAAKELISKELLPHAEVHDKWLASVFQCLLGNRLDALYTLVGKDDGYIEKAPLVLDPDVGEYCRLLFSKPGVQPNASVQNRAYWISALALKKLGFPMQALEKLSKCVSAVSPSTAGDWISPSVTDELSKAVCQSLVLKYMIPFVEQHSTWELPAGRKPRDDTVLQEMSILENKFSFNRSTLLESLYKMSWHHERPLFGYWLLNSASAFPTEQLGFSAFERILDFAVTSSPEALAATTLACGSAACLGDFSGTQCGYEDVTIDEAVEQHIGLQRQAANDDRSLTCSQIHELRVHARQIHQLATVNGSGPQGIGIHSTLALIVSIGTAWLDRQPEHLLTFVRMMLDTDTLDFNASLSSEPEDQASARAEVGGLSAEDAWLVLGVALWTHVLAFTKRQFSGGVPEVSYSGFGRVSPRLSTVESVSRLSAIRLAGESRKINDSKTGNAVDGQGRALSSSLTCIVTRLRKKLGLRMTSVGAEHVLYKLLWEHGEDPFPEGTSLAELWKLLSVNEEARLALRLEGLDGSKKQSVKVGWVDERVKAVDRTSSLPADSSTRFQQHRTFNVKGLIRSHFNTRFGKGEDALHLPGDTLEAMAVNNCSSEQVVIASANKGLVYLNLDSYGTFSDSKDNLWGEAEWPQNSWAGSVSTPVPTYVSPGVGLGSKGGAGIGLGGAAVGTLTLSKELRKGAVGFGVPGYAGMAAWNMGWEEMTDFDGFVDPPATVGNVNTAAIASHPLRPFFLVGARNTHVYLWKFGETSATATYGVLPAANVPPPYALASVSAVEFDRCGHRFSTSAVDGTVCTWQLDVGGRSNVCPTESHFCFDRHAWDVHFIGESGATVAATGSSRSGENLVIWNTLAPHGSASIAVACHEGGAKCLDIMHDGSGASPLIITGGKRGDVSVHDYRYMAGGKSKRRKNGYQTKKTGGEQNDLVWHIPKAHTGTITKIRAVPGTSLFLTGSRDGDVKLWDVNKCELIKHWHRVHEKRLFLQQSTPGLGALAQASVMDLRILPNGFITCGTDGVVKHFCLESEAEYHSS